MSSKAGKRPMRPLSTREKLEAIHRVHDGESKASVARDIGVPESTLRGWCKNEDKIALLSRQSSPETDESVEHQDKKKKLDENLQPFNLSIKSTAGPSAYSPNSEQRYGVDYSKTSGDKIAPLDLKTKSNKDCNVKTSSVAPNSQTERERNRAELARLSVELGLNRPEMFMNVSNAMTDMNMHVLWNQLLLQQQSQIQGSKKMPSPLGNSSNIGNTSGGSLLTTVNHQADKQSPLRLPNETISVEDSIKVWLNSSRSAATSPHQSPNYLPSSNGYPTSLSTPANNTSTSSPTSGLTAEHSAWIMKLYKDMFTSQYATSQYAMQLQAPVPDKILYQQLTKDKEAHNAENLSISASLPEDRPGAIDITNPKARQVLEKLLNNNNVSANKDKPVSQDEAVTHGEKFLRWLESCSEPSVTSMHIMQFRSLLNNVKASADRKNGEVQLRVKMKRK